MQILRRRVLGNKNSWKIVKLYFGENGLTIMLLEHKLIMTNKKEFGATIYKMLQKKLSKTFTTND